MSRLIIMILVCAAILGDCSLARPYSISKFGDVVVENNGDSIKCDQVTCPAGTARCQVTKFKDDPASNVIVRRNICYGRNGEVLLEKSTQDASAPGHTENLNIVVSENGNISQSVYSSGDSTIINDQNVEFDVEAFNKTLQVQIDQTLQAIETLKQKLNQSFWGDGGIFSPWG